MNMKTSNSRINAFTINRLGGSFFPLSVKVDQQQNVSSIFVCAQSVVDVCDLIIKHAKSHLVLFGVEQTSKFEENTNNPLPLKGLAVEARVSFSALDSETLDLPKASLLPLLTTFDHHNLNLFDVESDWGENQVISQILAYQDHKWQEKTFLLQNMPSSQLFLTSFDDCYLTIESYNPEISKEVFARTLQIFSGTYLESRINLGGDLPEIPVELVNSFWRDNFGLTILEQNTRILDGCLKIGVSLKPFNFTDSLEYPSEEWLVYNIQNQTWFY